MYLALALNPWPSVLQDLTARYVSAVEYVIHDCAPPSATEHEGERQMRDREIITRLPTSPDEFNAGLSAALREADVSAKAVAQIVEKSPRHTEKWIAGERSPTAFDIFAIARQVPAVQRWVAYLAGLEADVLRHNDWQRELARFERALAAMKEGGEK